MRRILFADNEFPDLTLERDLFARADTDLVVAQCRTEDDVIAAARDCAGILLQYAPITRRVVTSLPGLGIVSRIGAGFDTVDTDACAVHGVWVANSPDYGVGEVATHALALALALVRNVVSYHRDIHAGKWHYLSSGPLRRVGDMTLGIIGLGRIGKRMAHVGRNVFRRVVACDPYIIDGDFPAYVERRNLAAVFAESDVVSLHVPLTAETRGMIGATVLGGAKPGAFLVNTSRGAVIDVDAALHALDKGGLAGVALDVLPVEPVPAGSKLLGHPRVILTPHAAFFSVEAERELRRKAAQNIITYLQTGRPDYVVTAGPENHNGFSRGGWGSMAEVDIRAVHKHFGSTHVIRGVDIAIADGEFCVLVGPSGCGKSTLLRMIAGLEEIGGGEIAIGGTVVNRVPPKERDIAMVFQNYALYPHMTVRDNMSFALMLAKRSKADIDERLRKAADILGLVPYLDRYPRQLSGGQRQRVAMGRAIVRDPQVFLFDEPLSNLDAKLRVQMRTEIKELHQRLKTTSIYVTHDQIEAMTMADKIVVMRDGLVEQTGGPLDLYDHPTNTFVAGFIGSPAMNMIPGTARAAGGALRVDFGGGVVLPPPAGVRADDGQPVLYGLRPEHCTLGAGGLPVDVVVVEPTGADTQLYCRFNGQEVTATIDDRTDCRAGDRINLAPDLGRAHLFDAASGRRLVA